MKGDSIVVTVGIGVTVQSFEVKATKGGRTVRHKTNGRWLDVEEMTAPSRANPKGRPAGRMLRVAAGSVHAIDIHRAEPEALPRKRSKTITTIPLGLSADG